MPYSKKTLVVIMIMLLVILVILAVARVENSKEVPQEEPTLDPEPEQVNIQIPDQIPDLIFIHPPEPTPETTHEPEFKGIECQLDLEIQEQIYNKCEEYGIEFELVLSIMYHESRFDASAISKTNDWGLMQINHSNHKWLEKDLGITDFLDPIQNTEAGLYMLRRLFDKYSDTARVLMAYNLGEGGALEFWEQGKYSNGYSRVIMDQAEIYKKERIGEK